MIITKKFDFDAAHSLPKVYDGHKCSRMHGHTYGVTLECGGTVSPSGFIVDFADIAMVWAPVANQIDHRVLNEVEGLENPTCENLAVWIFRRVKPSLTALVAVTVHESSTTTCRVTAEDC
jgi:6-pyruvoyltetrahydropterin/6-carboxytetrahydropterin synthase